MSAVAAAVKAQHMDMEAACACASCVICDNCNPAYAALRATHIAGNCHKGRPCGECSAACVCLCEHNFDGRRAPFRVAGKFTAGAGVANLQKARAVAAAARAEVDKSSVGLLDTKRLHHRDHGETKFVLPSLRQCCEFVSPRALELLDRHGRVCLSALPEEAGENLEVNTRMLSQLLLDVAHAACGGEGVLESVYGAWFNQCSRNTDRYFRKDDLREDAEVGRYLIRAISTLLGALPNGCMCVAARLCAFFLLFAGYINARMVPVRSACYMVSFASTSAVPNAPVCCRHNRAGTISWSVTGVPWATRRRRCCCFRSTRTRRASTTRA